MLIKLEDVRVGDTFLFKGSGAIFNIFDFLLCIFEKKWRAIPKSKRRWHMGKAWEKANGGWMVFEGWSPLSRRHFYSDEELAQRAVAVRWLDKPLSDSFKSYCEKEYLNKRYDVPIYFYTMLQYLIRHYWNRRIARLLDDRFTCWELCQAIDTDAGKSWGSKYDCVLITDFPPIYEEKNEPDKRNDSHYVCPVSLHWFLYQADT